MSRRPRVHIAGGFYHVILRGNHRQRIFAETSDWQRWEEILANALDRLEARIHGFCWMTNHVHMLIEVGTAPLSQIIQRVASAYARYFQRKLSTTGHLFERRHRAILVPTDDYVLQLLYYFHMNPVTAKLVDDPIDYRWSSHTAYLGLVNIPWLTTSFALSVLSDNPTEARSLFLEYFANGDPDKASSVLSDSAAERAGASNEPRTCLADADLTRPVRLLVDLDTLIGQVAARYGVTPQELESTSKRRRATQARAEIARQAQELEIATLSDVARRFGRSTATMSRSVSTLRNKRSQVDGDAQRSQMLKR